MKKITFITTILLLLNSGVFGQIQNSSLFISTIKFNKIPDFNYAFSVSFNKYKNQYKLTYFQPSFSSGQINRHAISYKTTRTNFGDVNLNPWNASDSRDGLILGGAAFLFNKLNSLK